MNTTGKIILIFVVVGGLTTLGIIGYINGWFGETKASLIKQIKAKVGDLSKDELDNLKKADIDTLKKALTGELR